ncbi:hypothetical protein [Escherichia coli]|uniref:hypothetical protein n=1 Tax=Escherichia coli TaxID=562 RepID=UPI0037DC419E
MASTFTSDTLPTDDKAAIRQMKLRCGNSSATSSRSLIQLSDDIETRVAEINALKAQGDAGLAGAVLYRYRRRYM